MKYPWAIPGAKVACIDKYIPPGPGYEDEVFDPITMGDIFTIEYVEEDDGVLWLALIERPDDLYEIVHFRPVISQSDDVALFTHHLDQNSIHVPESA